MAVSTFGFAGFIGDVVEVAFGVGVLVVGGGGDLAVADAEDAGDKFDGEPAAAMRVAHHRFGWSFDGDVLGEFFAEDGLDGHGFGGVVLTLVPVPWALM